MTSPDLREALDQFFESRRKATGRGKPEWFDEEAAERREAYEQSRAFKEGNRRVKLFRRALQDAARKARKPYDHPDTLIRQFCEAGCGEGGVEALLAAFGAAVSTRDWKEDELYGIRRERLGRYSQKLKAVARDLRLVDRSLLASPGEFHARREARVAEALGEYAPLTESTAWWKWDWRAQEAEEEVVRLSRAPALLEEWADFLKNRALATRGGQVSLETAMLKTVVGGLRYFMAQADRKTKKRPQERKPGLKEIAQLLNLVSRVAMAGGRRTKYTAKRIRQRISKSPMPAIRWPGVRRLADRFLRSL